MTAKTLLCVSPYVPWSGIEHAGGSYLYHYLREFNAMGWDVQLASPRSEMNESARDELLASDPAVVVHLYRSRARSKFRVRAELIAAGREGVPPRSWRGGPDLAMLSRQATIIDLQWHDIYGHAKWFAQAAPRTPLVALAHDLRSQSVRRNADAARMPKRALLRLAEFQVRARERRHLMHCDGILAFKKADLYAVRQLGPDAPGVVAPPFVEMVSDDVAPDVDSRTLVFSAAFFRSENFEAAHWFLDAVWPLVKARVPDARVRLAGSRPPEDLVARASRDVEVTGYLPSIVDGYRGALLAIAPLNRGAGLKFKVIQAMALGFPIVGTSVAMEGVGDFLNGSRSEGYDDARAFANRIVEILENPNEAVTEAEQVAKALRNQLDFAQAMASLSSEYEGIIRSRRGVRGDS